ncbi:hypothetical protein [Bradyrhizobium sp.]
MGTFGTNTFPQNPFGYIGPILSDGEQKMSPQTGNTTASAVAVLNTTISASTAYNVINNNCRGALFYLKVSAFPGSLSTTVALKVRMQQDPIAAGGTQFLLAAFPAVSSSAGVAFMCYPAPMTVQAASGFSSSTNYACIPLPRNYQVLLSISTGATSKEVTFSLSVMHLV